MSESVLSVRSVVGGYSRKRPVLRQVSVEVKAGELVGLVGLNGAGKSTLMKHVIGLLQPQQGEIEVCGHRLDQANERYRSSFAFVPESPLLYDELSVWEHLEWTAMAYDVPEATFRERGEALLERFRMSAERKKFAAHLSKGMRQKVMLMCAFLVKPPLYIIDEPFLGLDPLAIQALLEQMREEKMAGAGLIVSSHMLTMMESYCDRYVVLHDGAVAAQGSADDIIASAGTPPEGKVEAAFFRLVGGGGGSA
ncbi:ABC transporter ATP-binding protein [Paenibacillus sp. TRM 82003]|nr:ABC transporter ATP-binding protein [Paenibacillus sp. TRM 82003]